MQKKKLIICGAKGMLGQELVEIFREDKNYEIFAYDVEGLDITKKDEVLEKIKEIRPQIVINAAAFTRVDDCEKPEYQKICFEVNGKAPGYLAAASKTFGAILVHYSTDYVFDGKKKEGYKEEDKDFAPVNIYGQSKLMGEKEVQKNTDRFYLIRTAWLYGRGGKNFVDTMLELAKTNKELKVVNDQHGSPTYARDLAWRTKELLEGGYEFGIYHLTNSGETTWFEFAKKIFEIAKINMMKIVPVKSSEFPRPAKRPEYSVLINTKLPKSRRWDEALVDYLKSKNLKI